MIGPVAKPKRPKRKLEDMLYHDDISGFINDHLLASDDYNRFFNGHAPANKLSAVVKPS